jgi:hypothetical protein
VPGIGTKLVDALANELEGSIERQFGQSGATVLLSFPMDPIMIDERPSSRTKRKIQPENTQKLEKSARFR